MGSEWWWSLWWLHCCSMMQLKMHDDEQKGGDDEIERGVAVDEGKAVEIYIAAVCPYCTVLLDCWMMWVVQQHW